MREVSKEFMKERFYKHYDPLPRDKWRATNPNARVAVDLIPSPPPENACPDCRGKGSQWMRKRPRKGVALVLVKCESCKGTGVYDAREAQEDETAERHGHG